MVERKRLSESPMIFGELLRDYIQKACPRAPKRVHDGFVREMSRALAAWVLSPDPEKKAVLSKYQARMQKKLIGPRQVKVGLEFSKRLNPDRSSLAPTTDQFFSAFFNVVSDYRINNEHPQGQLSFRIDGIDMNHPKLAIVECTVEGTEFHKRELKHAQGRTNRKRAGRPASIKIDFGALESVNQDCA